MSTRSAIIIETAAGYSGIYCHSDGYPEWVGFLLQRDYATPEKAAALVALGDLYTLNSDGTVEAFHRDRDEKWEDAAPVTADRPSAVAKLIGHDGHIYVFEQDRWSHNGDLLSEVLDRPSIKAQTASMHPPVIPDTPTPRICTGNRLLPFRPVAKAPVKSLEETLSASPPQNIIPLHSQDSRSNPSAKPPSKKDRIAAGIAALTQLQPFIGHRQSKVVATLIRTSEEQDFFIDKMIELAALVKTMPHTFQQDGLGDQAIVHLHYFTGGCDWWITERDMGDPEDTTPNLQVQAFGYSCLGDPTRAELGYVSLPEILNAGAELDFHWNPTALAEIKAKLAGN